MRAIASSEVVAENLRSAGFEEIQLWPNVADTEAIGAAIDDVHIERAVGAIFAGNLTSLKIDFDLLEAILAAGIPLHLAGPVDSWGDSAERVERLMMMGAVHHGVLNVAELAKLSASLTLGLIPYSLNAYTKGVSPLKTYE
ncbi:glycosyltransferase family protein, partial [Clavibacter michiganensis]|uniref:hypothetical protein n=1 Tax=Clavibacter michiganensis TaxID=28447 RepID=UPI00292DB450